MALCGARVLVALLSLSAPSVWAQASAAADQTPLILEIDAPPDQSRLEMIDRMAFVSGRALAPGAGAHAYDVVVVIDSSASTSESARMDADRDGYIEVAPWLFRLAALTRFADDDCVLAGEIAAAHHLVDQLDPRTTRIGVVSFRGDQDPRTEDAWTWLAPAHDYARVRRALDRVEADGSRGMTNLAAGVRAALDALRAAPPRLPGLPAAAEAHVLFLTDGHPTAPRTFHANVRETLEAAADARRAGVRVHSFALGARAEEGPLAAVEMARVSGGRFIAVRDLAQLALELERIDLSDIEELRVFNRSLRRGARHLRREPDGGFSALVEVTPGVNSLCAAARSADGRKAQRCVRIRVSSDGGSADPLDPRYVSQRNRLLSEHLQALQARSVGLQLQRDQDALRSLQIEIERRRRAPQRSLRIAVEPRQ